jgi:transposase
LESLLEEAQVKLSSLVSDLFGLSARRMLRALADGETDPVALAALGDRRLHASQEQLRDALGAAADLKSTYRRLVGMALDELQLLERHMSQLDQEMADLLTSHQDAVQRLAEVPGLGVESAHQIIAEVGAAARTFPSEKHLASWIGVCPGEQESAGFSASKRSPKGNRLMRRLLNQCAHAAVKVKGSIFETVFRRLLPRLGFKQAIWAIAHRLSRLIWKILHQGVRYEERGPAVNDKLRSARTAKMIKELKNLGYRVEPTQDPA